MKYWIGWENKQFEHTGWLVFSVVQPSINFLRSNVLSEHKTVGAWLKNTNMEASDNNRHSVVLLGSVDSMWQWLIMSTIQITCYNTLARTEGLSDW